MGSSEHPCDWLSRIYGLSVDLFRGYPLIRVSEDVLDYLVHVLRAPAVGAADLEGVDVGDAQFVRQRFMGVLRDAVPERAAGDVD